jgi:hypothetical protein
MLRSFHIVQWRPVSNDAASRVAAGVFIRSCLAKSSWSGSGPTPAAPPTEFSMSASADPSPKAAGHLTPHEQPDRCRHKS